MYRALQLALVVLCLGWLTVAAEARCRGVDLRQYLAPSDQADVQRHVARIPFSEGNHWIATRGNRTLHIIGTQHTGDNRMGAVMRRLRPIIEKSDAVLLEVAAHAADAYFSNLEDLPEIFALKKPPYLDTLLSEQAWTTLREHFGERGFPPQLVARMQPWYAGFYLSGSNCGGRGIGAYRGLDDRIEKMARRARVPIGSLETPSAGLIALSRQPLRDQVKTLELDLRSRTDLDSVTVTLVESYFDEQLAVGMRIQDLVMYSDLDVSRSEVVRLSESFNRQMLDYRNTDWIKVIERTQGDTLFIAVGAAHLPGDMGVPNLLKRKGYALTRAPF